MTPDRDRPKTPKEIAKEKRDRRLRNRVLAAVGALALVVIGVLAYGWYDVNVLSKRRPVITVNGETVSQQRFQARVRLVQLELLNRIQQTRSLASFVGGDPQAQQSIEQQIQQMQQQLSNPTLIGQQVVQQLIRETLIRQEAQERGISVTEEEVDELIQEVFGYFPEGTPTPLPTNTPRPTATVDPTAAAESTATATATERATEASGPTSTPLPTATPYTLEEFQDNYSTYIESISEAGIREEDYRWFAEAEVYREKLLEDFRQDVSRSQEQVNARHILVEDEETAQEVLDRLEEGDSFSELAAEYSIDQSNSQRGGDLGWFGRGQMVEGFEQAAFEAEVGEVVGPVETQFGFHIIEVLEREERRLDDQAFERQVQIEFNEWLSEQRQEADIEIADDWVEIVPTIEGAQRPAPQSP